MTGRPSATATRTPTWKSPVSAASLPKRIRSNGAVRGLLGLDRLGDRAGGRDRVPLAAVGLEQDRPLDADRHRVAELLLGLGRPERQDGGRAALRLDDPDRLLDAALLVRADREAEEARVDVLPVGGQHDPPAGLRARA